MTRPARVAASTISMFSCDALDLAEDRIERMLQRAVDRIPLRRPQLVEIPMDPFARARPVSPWLPCR